jgi:hypothetical protein
VNSIFALRALAEKSSLQPRENRRYDAARKAAVEAICSEKFTGYDRGADKGDLQSSLSEKANAFWRTSSGISAA